VSGPREHRFGAHAGLLWLPDGATSFLALAHGAGAGMRHAFLEAIAGALARCRVATLRFEFPYAAAAARRPDPKPVLLERRGRDSRRRAYPRQSLDAATGHPRGCQRMRAA
jgi:predicted alpha/beta-hydrolase family hydrolase